MLGIAIVLGAGWILRDFKVIYNVKDTYYVITYFTISQAIVIISTVTVLLVYTFLKILNFYNK